MSGGPRPNAAGSAFGYMSPNCVRDFSGSVLRNFLACKTPFLPTSAKHQTKPPLPPPRLRWIGALVKSAAKHVALPPKPSTSRCRLPSPGAAPKVPASLLSRANSLALSLQPASTRPNGSELHSDLIAAEVHVLLVGVAEHIHDKFDHVYVVLRRTANHHWALTSVGGWITGWGAVRLALGRSTLPAKSALRPTSSARMQPTDHLPP